MANRIYIKRSNVAGKIPTSADLDLGEMGLNTADVKLYASGTTANSILPIGWDRVARTGDTLTGNFNINGSITANTFVKSGGTNSQFLMADGSITNGTTNFIFTGTTNYVQKAGSVSGLSDSIIYDNGSILGINTINLSGDAIISLGSQVDRKIGIVDTLTGAGKNLTVKASTTYDNNSFTGQSNDFQIDSGSVANPTDLTITPDGTVWISSTNGLYKKVSGGLTYPQVNSTGWLNITHSSNSTLYAIKQSDGQLYKSTDSGVTFSVINSGLTGRTLDLLYTSAGAIYRTIELNKTVFKSTNLGVSFSSNYTFTTYPNSIAENGSDIYIGTQGGDLYKQTSGSGSFVATGSFIGGWLFDGLCFRGNDIYVTNSVTQDIHWLPFGGTRAELTPPNPNNTYMQIKCAPNGDLYTILYTSSTINTVYKSLYLNINADKGGGVLKLETGAGIGSGITSIDFILAPTTSAGVQQTKSTLMQLANNGDLTLSGRYIKQGGLSTQFLMADGSTSTGGNDIRITGGTFNNNTKILTLNNNTGGTVTVTGFTDTFATGGTFNQGSRTLTINNNTGGTFTITGISDVYATGGTFNGSTITVTNNTGGTFTIGGFSTGGSVSFTGTTNYVQKLNSTSALTNSLIYDNASAVLIGVTTSNGVDKLQVSGSVCSIGGGLKYTYPYDITNLNLNNIVDAGFYNGANVTNSPAGDVGWYYLTVERHVGNAEWVHQLATSMGAGNTGNKMYSRCKLSGTWGSWVTII